MLSCAMPAYYLTDQRASQERGVTDQRALRPGELGPASLKLSHKLDCFFDFGDISFYVFGPLSVPLSFKLLGNSLHFFSFCLHNVGGINHHLVNDSGFVFHRPCGVVWFLSEEA
jgi:hypothetical protein